jgi:Tol biopolymer transport system component
MTSERWQQVAAIYDAALELPPDERTRYVASECADDPSLRADVDALLAQDGATGPLDRPVWVADNLLVQPTPLPIGASIGSYRVEGILGAGGMGQVYRARDTKLGRRVALKVLPDIFAKDPERRARFQREAQVLAALNHPHIGAIHGFEDGGSVHALVLELVDGPTLADRLAKGALPVDESLAIAQQVVDALDAAHDQGIIHRDLKPANIAFTPDGAAKVLDFGLARLVLPEGYASTDIGNSPTITSPAMTHAGTILGTAAYMSPEQAKGRPADARSDVWAFGCVFYEMLTGARPYAGEDVADTLAAVLRAEPDWSALPSSTPPAIRRLLQRCLQKDRKRRLAAIADVRLYIEEAQAVEVAVARPSTRTAWWAATLAGVVALVALVALTTVTLRPPAEASQPREVTQFTIAPPDNVSFASPPGGGTGNGTHVAISPDGRNIVFVANKDGLYQLWIRPISAVNATPIAGTEGAAFPFWSPDSRSVAFFSGNKLKKIQVDGGPAVVLCDALSGRGGSWNRDNVIIFTPSTGSGGLQRVPAAGGVPSELTTVDPSGGETNHRWPHFLPDGRHFLFTSTSGACCPPPQPGVLRVGSLDPNEPAVTLMEVESAVTYVSGHLLFGRANALMAQPFDADTRQLRGDAFPIADNLSWENGRYASISASVTGTLVYGLGGASRAQQLTWFDRSGRVLSGLGDATPYETVTLSPDGRQAAVSLRTGSPPTLNVWLYSVANGTRNQLTTIPGSNGFPVWSPDSKHIVYENEHDGEVSLRQISVDGQGDVVLARQQEQFRPTSWSRQGLIAIKSPGTQRSESRWFDLSAFPLSGDHTLIPIARTSATETLAAFSPDGRSIAFVSSEAGQGASEVFVQAFPGPGLKTAVSRGGGSYPVWRPDGKELFYIANSGTLDGTLMAVAMGANGQFEGAAPQPLFRPNAPRFNLGQIYAVTADGQRFLVNARPESSNVAPITVVVNWPATLTTP